MATEYDFLESLAVRIDKDEDSPLESSLEYSVRLQKTWPDFPFEVIEQWFYEHRQAIHQNSWLPYETLKFELKPFSTTQIIDECLSLSEMAKHFERHTQLGTDTPRLNRLSEYIRANGTWPKPPIALANPGGTVSAHWGPCDSPFHLLEGFHRAGVLLAVAKSCQLLPTHSVWVATLVS